MSLPLLEGVGVGAPDEHGLIAEGGLFVGHADVTIGGVHPYRAIFQTIT